MHEVLKARATDSPSGRFVDDLTFSECLQQAEQFASVLRERGIRSGDRVVLALRGGPAFAMSLFGVMACGGVAVPIGDAKRGRQSVIDDSDAQAVITHDGPARSEVVQLGKEKVTLTVSAGPEDRREVRLVDEDPCLMFYSSGSTGRPKGIVMSHASALSAVRSVASYLCLTGDDVVASAISPGFDYGLHQYVLAALSGATLITVSSAVFVDELVELISARSATVVPIVPSLGRRIVEQALRAGWSFPGVRMVTSTGSALGRNLAKRLMEVFPSARIFSMYGLTECHRVSYLEPELLLEKPDSVGLFMPHVDGIIVDDSGSEVAAGDVGELIVRGTNVALGYWRRPDETRSRFMRDELGRRVLRTGDLFKKDQDGFLFWQGRRDDLVKVRDEIVSLGAVEALIRTCDGVLEARCSLDVDDDGDPVLTADVVPDDGVEVNETELRRRLVALAPSAVAVPSRITVVRGLPENARGKVTRKGVESGDL